MKRITTLFTCARPWAVYVLFSAILFGGCKDSATSSAEIKKDQDQALKELDQSFEKLKTDHAEVVDFRVLKEAMPEKLLGMPRVTHDGQKSGIAGLNISSASAEYQEDSRKISISITDTGGFGSAISGLATWSQLEVDKETQDGYERTTTIGGKKAIEKFNRTSGEGEIAMIAADRFIVTVNGSGISEGDLRTAIEKISIKN
jgi:hypothetical protein